MTRPDPISALCWLALILLLLFTPGCDTEEKPMAAPRLQYFRDDRTSLCFAYLEEGVLDQSRMGLAAVPCSPEVLALTRQAEAPAK